MIDWNLFSALDAKNAEVAVLGQTTVKYMRLSSPVSLYSIGIDPGKHFGIAIFNGNYLDVFWGTMKTYPSPDRWRYGIEAVHISSSVKSAILGEELTGKKAKTLKLNDRIAKASVEGAAYKKREGQVNLAEIRFGFAYGLYELGYDVKITPPSTARKAATGNGNVSVGTYLPLMNNNACDAIGIAAYAAGYNAKEAGWEDGKTSGNNETPRGKGKRK